MSSRVHLKKAVKVAVIGVSVAAMLASPSIAMADGGGTGAGGGGGVGGGPVDISWNYTDSRPATVAGVKASIAAMGVTAAHNGDSLIQSSLNEAITECKNSFVGEGSADCRLVSVGIAHSNSKWYPTTHVDDPAPWLTAWAAETNGKTYNYNGRTYNTAQTWKDKSGTRSVNSMVASNVAGLHSAAIRVVVLAHNQPFNPSYKLTVRTQQANGFALSGGTQAVHDVVTTSNGGSGINENVTAKTIAYWDGYPSGTVSKKSVTKSFTMTNNGTANSPSFVPSDFGWSMWPAGRIWYNTQIAKQGSMEAAVNTSDRQASEQFTSKPNPPKKSLYKSDGTTLVSSDDVLSSAMKGVAKVSAESAGSTNFWLYDTEDTKDVWLGGSEADDFSKITVTDASGKTVNATISVDDSQDGKRLVKAHLSNAPVGIFTLNVPFAPKPTEKNFTIVDDSKACWNGDGDTCQSGDSKKINKVTPTPNKVWVLDKDGALVANDPKWTNNQGADNKVFTPGDKVGAVVNGSFPNNLASDLDSYSITDDWTDASKYVDFTDTSLAKVFVDGQDVTSQFTISVQGTKTIAVAKDSILKGTAGLKTAKVVKLYIAGSFIKSTDTNGNTVRLTNAGSEKWNNETIPTNVPPVYVWTPNPTKDVYGALNQDGNNADASINTLRVFPGQSLKYNVGIDVNTPNTGDRAYEYKKFGIQDNYDINFVPNKTSVTIIDNRDGSKPVARKNYKVTWDDANHTFSVMFDTTFIKDYLGNSAHVNDSAANKAQWLSLAFSGKVKSSVLAGTDVRNQAFQIVNDSKTATEIPVVHIPDTKPSKEDLDTAGNDIDSKTVMKGDSIVYRLTLDASPTQKQLAYYVHKLGMTDDYDQGYLSLDASGVQVLDKDTGSDVTSKFNIQVKDGVAYVFAKQVDHTNVNGDLIKGDPQPSDLKSYDAADIDPLNGPTIDQTMMGHKYWVILNTKVIKSTDGYVIKNQAIQNLENQKQATNIVSNPLKELHPKKDVTVDVGGKSIDGTTVKLGQLFNYKLGSSSIPANRAYKSTQWGITDSFNTKMDRYTGQWVVLADTDVYDGKTLVFKKGDNLATSRATDVSKYLKYDESTKSLTLSGASFEGTSPDDKAQAKDQAKAKAQTLDSLVTAGDIKVAEDGSITLLKNLVDADNNVVVIKGMGIDLKMMSAKTTTPLFTMNYQNGLFKLDATKAYFDLTNTRLDLAQKWTAYAQMERINVGTVDNTFVETYNNDVKRSNKVTTNTPEHPAITIEKWDEQSGKDKGDRDSSSDALTVKSDDKTAIKFTIKNTGDVPLVNVKISDKTIKGSGSVKDITCPSSFQNKLAVGEEVTCSGTLTGIKAGDTHTDTATVTGESFYTGKKVTSSDDWNGKVNKPNKPIIPAIPKLGKTGADILGVVIAAVLVMSTGAGLLLVRRRKSVSQGSHVM